MTFGFADDTAVDDKPTELEHKTFDKLRWKTWDSLFVGMHVQSVLNGVKGKISFLDDRFKQVFISWDNGNESRASLTELTKVIVIDEH